MVKEPRPTDRPTGRAAERTARAKLTRTDECTEATHDYDYEHDDNDDVEISYQEIDQFYSRKKTYESNKMSF